MYKFLEVVHSEYSSLVSLRCGMSQSSILSSRLDDRDRMDEVSDSLSANPDYRLFPENPLMLGFYLNSVRNGKLASTTFLEEVILYETISTLRFLKLLKLLDCTL